MRAALLAFLLALGLAPAAASAVVRINIEQFDFFPTGADQIVWVDVFAQDLDNSDEKLDAFTIAIDGPNLQPDGIRFAPPAGLPSARHPYVFSDFPGAEPEDFSSTYNRLQVGAAISTGNVNIGPDRNGFFSIPLLIPRDFPFGFYPMVVDPTALSLGGAGNPVAVPGGPGGFNYIPEPAAPALLLVGLFMLVRNRRRSVG